MSFQKVGYKAEKNFMHYLQHPQTSIILYGATAPTVKWNNHTNIKTHNLQLLLYFTQAWVQHPT